MLKTLIVTILTAFTCGLLAETAVVLVQGVQGVYPDIHTAIELGVCWFVVLAAFYISVLKSHTSPTEQSVGLSVCALLPALSDCRPGRARQPPPDEQVRHHRVWPGG